MPDAAAQVAAAQARLIRQTQLPPQLWIDFPGTSGRPRPDRMAPPADLDDYRPQGGLWTSTWRSDTHDSAYLAALKSATAGQLPTRARPVWLLHPRTAPVWVINNRQAEIDMRILAAREGSMWQQVAGHADAAHMSNTGAAAFLSMPPAPAPTATSADQLVHRLRLAMVNMVMERGPYSPLDWWYGESTYWMRWSFDRVEQLPDLVVPDVAGSVG